MKRNVYIVLTLLFATLLITSSCDSAFVDESSVNMSQPEQKTENDINKNDHSTSEKEESNDNENSDASIENSSGSSSEIDLVKGRPVYATWAEYVSEHKTPLVGKNIADFGKISEVVEILLVHPHKDHVVLSTPNSAIFIYPLSEEEAQNKKPCIFYLEKEYAFDTFGIIDAETDTTNCYKIYQKEGVDIHVCTFTNFGRKNYELLFKIENYMFRISDLNYYVEPKDWEDYTELKPRFENSMWSYEINDFSHDKSELVKILKEIIDESK